MPGACRAVAVSMLCVIMLAGRRVEGQAAPRASADSAKFAVAQEALRQAGTVDVILAGINRGLDVQRTAHPEVPAEFWTRIEQRFGEAAPELADSIAVLYANTFSRDELQAFVAFYQSPAGQHLRQVQPLLMEQSAGIGQRMGMRIGAEVSASMAEDGN